MIDRHLLILSLLLSLGLQAQDVIPERFRLGENNLKRDSMPGNQTVVSASKNAKFLDELPVTVYVVSREEILANGYSTLVDVLKDVPGIKVSQPGSGIEGESFLMNGLYGNYYCKILVNGTPVTPSASYGTVISGNLPVRQAERIEIISGPAAALYGSDALAGVVNIITRKSDRPVWAQTNLSVGSQGFYNLDVMIGGKFGKNKNVAEYSLYGNYDQASDMNVKYDIAGNYDPNLYDTTAIYEPHYRGTPHSPEMNRLPSYSSLLGIGLRYRGLEASFEHMTRSTHSSIGLTTAYFGYYDPTTTWGESIDKVSVGYNADWKHFSAITKFSLLTYRMDNNSSFQLLADRGTNGRVYQYAASDDFFFDEILTYSKKNLDISGGFSFQLSSTLPLTNELAAPFDRSLYEPFSEKIDYSDPLLGSFGLNPKNFYNLAGYLQLYYTFGKLNILAGGRWDQHSIFGSNFSPKAGFQYRITPDLSFRLSYGHGFRTPSLSYVYKSLAYPTDTSVVYENIPNTGLKAEKFRAFETGMRYHILPKVDLELIFMYHRLVENISFSGIIVDPSIYPDPDNFIALAAVNDKNSRAELYMGQVIVRARDLVHSVKLNSNLYITLSKGKEILPNNLGTLDDYRNMPNWMVQWQIDLQPTRKWVAILHNNFSSSWKKRFFPVPLEDLIDFFPVETRGYYTLDLVNRYRINRNFHAFLSINNVFNAKYGGIDAYGGLYDLIYNPQLRRHFRLGFNFTMD